MGREARLVPANWEHPKDGRGRHIPLYPGDVFEERLRDWDDGAALWAEGLIRNWGTKATEPIPEHHTEMTYEEYVGPRPHADDYMPMWAPEERTHYMMYETTSEGTPISPAFATPEELARWLADTGASAFADMTADYAHWLEVIRGAYAPDLVAIPTPNGTKFMSGISLLEVGTTAPQE